VPDRCRFAALGGGLVDGLGRIVETIKAGDGGAGVYRTGGLAGDTLERIPRLGSLSGRWS